MKIHSCLMTQNELNDVVANVEAMLPWVDTVTVVDGGSSDQTILYMRNWASVEPKLRFCLNQWQDNYPRQRNFTVGKALEVATSGDWLLVLDPDEVLDLAALQDLRKLTDIADSQGLNMIRFRSRSVSYRGPKRVWQSHDDYWKYLLVKWSDQFIFSSIGSTPVHESLDGSNKRPLNPGHGPLCPTEYFYEHRKQEDMTWIRATRNYFMGGGGPNLGHNNYRWPELLNITDRLKIEDWAAFWRYLVRGNVDQELKDWLIRYRHEDGWDGASEQREFYKTYFYLLHPEEEPEGLREDRIQ